MMKVAVAAVSVLGPGLDGWDAARAVFRGDVPYQLTAMRNPVPGVLSPGERRRASLPVRLAIEVAQQAVSAAAPVGAAIPAVFGSSDGDSDTIHDICSAISTEGYPVSPTRFHNSVHNAAAGYWSIAAVSRQASSSVCGYDETCSVALLDAVVQTVIERSPTLLVVFDVVCPSILPRVPVVLHPFAFALVLLPSARARCPVLTVDLIHSEAAQEWPPDIPIELATNPAARVVPLLRALARTGSARVRIPYGPEAHVLIGVEA